MICLLWISGSIGRMPSSRNVKELDVELGAWRIRLRNLSCIVLSWVNCVVVMFVQASHAILMMVIPW